MKQTNSIRFRLTLVSVLVFVLVVVLGLFSLWRLTGYNAISAEVRDRYLPNTQFLGDLNNFTSDFRAAEANGVLVAGDSARQANRKEIEQLDRMIALAEHSFEHIPNAESEIALYQDFVRKWRAYREQVGQVLYLSAGQHQDAAVALYAGASRQAYDAASNALEVLTERNRLNARNASRRADGVYEQASWLILAGVLLGGVIVLGGLTHIRRKILRPLLNLVEAMHQLAANDMNIQIAASGRMDEIGEMERAIQVFHRNAIDLAVNQRALAEQASLLSEKLAHEQHLSQLQRNFISMASHEFRTPLTVIDGQAQRLVNTRDRIGPDGIAERAGKIRHAVARMIGVTSSLVDTARLMEEGGNLFVHPAEFDMSQLLREVCHLYREVAPRTAIVENLPQRPLSMTGDHKLLFQVFSNIMSNAVKYSRDQSSIGVSAKSQGERVVVSITDKGVGIPAQDRERLFERYYRGSNISGIVGTGIGLFLVKTVVDLHGGTVIVDSTEGKGSTFTVTLPMKMAEPADGGDAGDEAVAQGGEPGRGDAA